MFWINLNLHLKFAILPDILVNFNLHISEVVKRTDEIFQIEHKNNYQKRDVATHYLLIFYDRVRDQHLYFLHQYLWAVLLHFLFNYLVSKKKNRARGKASRSFLNTEGFRFTGCDKATPQTILITVNNFILPVIKCKLYFETKTPDF